MIPPLAVIVLIVVIWTVLVIGLLAGASVHREKTRRLRRRVERERADLERERAALEYEWRLLDL